MFLNVIQSSATHKKQNKSHNQIKQFPRWRMNSVVLQPEGTNCSYVWCYGSRYFCVCLSAGGWTGCVWGWSLSFRILRALWSHLTPLIPLMLSGYWWCSGWFPSPAAEASCPGPWTSQVGCFQLGFFLLLICEYLKRNLFWINFLTQYRHFGAFFVRVVCDEHEQVKLCSTSAHMSWFGDESFFQTPNSE